MPRAVDYDLCAFCPRLCRHACPVAVGSGREAATPTHVMAGVWGWLQEHRSAPEALALASLCTRCGACTDACKLARPVDDLLTEARGAAAPEPPPPAPLEIHGAADLVALHIDDRAWAGALAVHLGRPVAWVAAPDHLGEPLLDHPEAFQRHAADLRGALEGRTVVAPSIGALRVARAADLPHQDLADLLPAPADRLQAPACGRDASPRAGQPALLSCCGACEPLLSAHPDVAAEVGRDQAARLGGQPAWTPDARCGAWLRHHGADVDDPIAWLLRHAPPPPPVSR